MQSGPGYTSLHIKMNCALLVSLKRESGRLH